VGSTPTASTTFIYWHSQAPDLILQEAKAFFHHGPVTGIAGRLQVVQNSGSLQVQVFKFLFER